jgi:uncharacterized protein YjbI with pentapeptide repeats
MSTIELFSCQHVLQLRDANLTSSSLHDVDLANSTFDLVSFEHAAFTQVTFKGATLRGVVFEGSTIEEANLTNVAIRRSSCEGMTIDGIRVVDALSAFRTQEASL